MLELVFVIVILGIVASLGSEMIAKVYQSYILQRAEHRASLKTELAATQIANRLRYAIPGTVIRRVSTAPFTSYTFTEELSQSMGTNPDFYNILQWVAYDGDSFEAIASDTNRKPGWSGFCDINISTDTIISSPGSNLDLTNTIIQNLSSGTIARDLSNAALYFPYDNIEHNLSSAMSATATDDNNITLDSNASRIVEHYKLAWSSYALVVDDGDLYLYYNFTPSPKVAIGAVRSLLLKNVSTFKFQGSGRTVRFKICKDENIGEDFNIISCKEKAVF